MKLQSTTYRNINFGIWSYDLVTHAPSRTHVLTTTLWSTPWRELPKKTTKTKYRLVIRCFRVLFRFHRVSNDISALDRRQWKICEHQKTLQNNVLNYSACFEYINVGIALGWDWMWLEDQHLPLHPHSPRFVRISPLKDPRTQELGIISPFEPVPVC